MTQRSTSFVLSLFGFAVCCAFTLAARAQAAELEPSPSELSRFSTPAIEQALNSSEQLIAFITAPQTTYKERRTATLRGADTVPPEFVPRLMKMIGELRDEQRLHFWGIEPHPHDAAPFLRRPNTEVRPTKRMVLGHEWAVPEKPQPYPISYEMRSAAPWPWQVQGCLDDLVRWMASRDAEIRGKDFGPRWMEACLTLPVGTDRDALLFVEATLGGSWMHHKSLPVMQRWLAISLDPNLPEAATRVAYVVGEECSLWKDPVARDVGDIITAEIIAKSPHESAREHAAYGIGAIYGADGHVPVPSVAAACERAADARIDPWRRLYVYAISAVVALQGSPIPPSGRSRNVSPGSPAAAQMLSDFDGWYAKNRQDLAKRATKREIELRSLIRQLKPSVAKKPI